MRYLIYHCAVVATMLFGCAARESVTPPTVAQEWQARTSTGKSADLAPTATSPVQVLEGKTDAFPQTPPPDRPIATVDGRPIARHRVIDVLLRSKGPSLLEQLIVLDAAEQLAAQRGLQVTPADVEREYDQALRRLTDPLAAVTPGRFDRQQAERVLDAVLARRNLSSEEFLMGVRRNAFLRRIVESQQTFSEEDLRAEFERLYGRRVRVRHIQLATPSEVARVQERLAAGEDFAELARRYSANVASAKEGGLLEPFSDQDERVPDLLRDVSFELQPGDVSGAVRVGDWYHFVQLVDVLPPEPVDFEQVRYEVEQRLRRRATEPAMRQLYKTLFDEADLRIHDQVLQEAFQQMYPHRSSAAGG